MERLSVRRNVLVAGLAAGSLLLGACGGDSEPSGNNEGSPSLEAPAGAYDLELTTIGEVNYESDEGGETGVVFEYTYVKDGIRTTCSAIHTDGKNETGLSGSCRFVPVSEQPAG